MKPDKRKILMQWTVFWIPFSFVLCLAGSSTFNEIIAIAFGVWLMGAIIIIGMY